MDIEYIYFLTLGIGVPLSNIPEKYRDAFEEHEDELPLTLGSVLNVLGADGWQFVASNPISYLQLTRPRVVHDYDETEVTGRLVVMQAEVICQRRRLSKVEREVFMYEASQGSRLSKFSFDFDRESPESPPPSQD